MARLGTMACIRLLALMLMVAPGSIMAQSACTDEQAKEKHGSLTLDRSNQSLLDSERRFKPDPAAQREIDQAIAILKQAIPDITGGEGLYSYSFSTPQPKRILVFSIRAGLFAYYCMPASYPGAHPGKISREDDSGTWITMDFNSLGTLVEERSNLGNDLRTPKGEMIFRLPKEGEFKGHRLFFPDKYGVVTKVVVLTAPGRFPFKPVSREEFLEAREKSYQAYIDKLPNSSASYADELEQIKRFHATLSPSELAQQAVVRDQNQNPARGKVFVSENDGGLRLVTIDRSYIDHSLPPSAVQLITLEWENSGQKPAKQAAMPQFENNLDLDALAHLLDR